MARSQARIQKRQQNMAVINAAILNAGRPQPTGTGIPPTNPLTPNVGPQPMTPKQQEAFHLLYQGGDIVQQHVKKMTPRQRAIYDAQVDLLGQEDADKLYYDDAVKQLQDEQKSVAQKAARDTWQATKQVVQSGKKIVHGADLSIGRLPTPGSLGFPLLLLILFFFILIQTNGNSRLGWLFLAVTNNAYAGDAAQGATAVQNAATVAQQATIGVVQQAGTGGGFPGYIPVVLPVSPNGVYHAAF